MTKPPLHTRLPKRAEAVERLGRHPGDALPPSLVPDPRTASPDPAQKPRAVQKATDGIIAELDHGPMGA